VRRALGRVVRLCEEGSRDLAPKQTRPAQSPHFPWRVDFCLPWSVKSGGLWMDFRLYYVSDTEKFYFL
jgi:hypothetical protein